MKFRLALPALALLMLVTPFVSGGTVTLVPVETFGRGLVTSSAISSDGRWLAVAASRDVLILDGDSFELRIRLRSDRSGVVRKVAFDRSGDHISAVLSDGFVATWDVTSATSMTSQASEIQVQVRPGRTADPKETAESPDLVPRFVRMDDALYSPNGRHVAGRVAHAEPNAMQTRLEIWDAIAESRVTIVPGSSSPPWYRFSADSRFLVVATYDRVAVQIVDLDAARVVPYASLGLADLASCGLLLREYQLARIPFLRDAYAFSGMPLNTELVRLLPEAYSEWARRWLMFSGMWSCDAMPPQVEASYRDQWLVLPDLAFAYSRPHRVWVIAVSKGRDVPPSTRGIQIWHGETHERLRILLGHHTQQAEDDPSELYYVHDLAFGPDGHLLVSGGADGTVRLWDAASESPLAIGEGHLAPVRTVAIGRGATKVLSGSEDGTVPSLAHRPIGLRAGCNVM